MNFKLKIFIVAIFTGMLNVGNASEYLGSFESGTYTSPEKSLVCSLPILSSSEDFTENYLPRNEGISFLFNGDSAHFSRTSISVPSGQGKYIKESMSIKNKLLAIEKYWSEALVEIMDSSDTKKEFIMLGKTNYRLFITTGTIESKAMGAQAQLYTIDGSNIIMYMISNLDKTAHDTIEKTLMSLYEKCKYGPAAI